MTWFLTLDTSSSSSRLELDTGLESTNTRRGEALELECLKVSKELLGKGGEKGKCPLVSYHPN